MHAVLLAETQTLDSVLENKNFVATKVGLPGFFQI
jgi:hypothetical protein